MIKRNLFYQSIHQITIVLIPLLLTPYISRVLGAEGIGIYSYTQAIAMYFVLFAMLGIEHHGSRSIATVRDNSEKLNRTFSNLVWLRIAISFVTIIFYAIFIASSSDEYRIFFIVQAPLVISALFDITWFFAGLENFRVVTVRNVLIRTISLILVFIFVNDRSDLWIYTIIMSTGVLLGQVSVWLLVKRYISFVKPSLSEIKPHIRPLLVLFIPVIALSVYNVLNRIMLGAMADSVELGFFANSRALVSIPTGFIIASNTVMIPRIANINAAGNDSEKSRLTLISMKYVMLLAFAMAFGIAAIANDFAPLFFGPEFADIDRLIVVLCIILPFLAFSNTLAAQYIVPHSKDMVYAASTVFAAVMSIVANLLFIPQYGAMGAVIGVIAAESTRCIILAVYSRKALPIFTYMKNSIFFLIAGIAMFFLVRIIGGLTDANVLSIILQVSIGAVFYLGVNTIYLYAKKDELIRRQFFKMKNRDI